MSHTSVSGFVATPRTASAWWVARPRAPLGRIRLRDERRFHTEFANSRPNSMMVAPNTLREQMTWSPALSSAMPSNNIAPCRWRWRCSLRPLQAARRRSNIVTVGLLKRE